MLAQNATNYWREIYGWALDCLKWGIFVLPFFVVLIPGWGRTRSTSEVSSLQMTHGAEEDREILPVFVCIPMLALGLYALIHVSPAIASLVPSVLRENQFTLETVIAGKPAIGSTVLNSGLVILILFSAPAVLGFWRRQHHTHALIYMFMITFPAAFTHSFSVYRFRWIYDNNPLIVVVLAFIYYSWLRLVSSLNESPVRRTVIFACLSGVALLFSLFFFEKKFESVKESTDEWPEISYLDGARMRPASSELRLLVSAVRALTDEDGVVLLLPNDPNVAAWFDRPSPRLTSAIIFADQYWDSYVDEDLARLKENPPDIIIVGPEYWRGFFSNWQGVNWGAPRLIDRVLEELVQPNYAYVASVHMGMRIFMLRTLEYDEDEVIGILNSLTTPAVAR